MAVEAASAAARRLVDLNRSEYRGERFVNDHPDASIQADLETEAAILRVLEEKRVAGTFLSEELLKEGQRPDLSPSEGRALGDGRRVYVVADPLDGSAIYAHNLPIWWYSCVGIYSEEGAPLAGCVVDVNRRVLYACDEERAWKAGLDDRINVTRWSPLVASAARPIEESWLAIYVMKPKYLAIAADRYRPLIDNFWALVPNGGPGGFTDCADAMADAYLHYDLPGTEHLSGGMMIAERAGCVVTDIDGSLPEFDATMAGRPTLVCASNAALHRRCLDLLNSD